MIELQMDGWMDLSVQNVEELGMRKSREKISVIWGLFSTGEGIVYAPDKQRLSEFFFYCTYCNNVLLDFEHYLCCG